MENNFASLINAIQQVDGRKVPILVVPDDFELSENRNYQSGDKPATTFENIFKLSYSQFPESDELSDEQMLDLIRALDHSFLTFDYIVEVPDDIPLAMKYELYRDLFNEEHFLMPGYTCHYDFCSGYCPGCKVRAYCDSCITNWEVE